MAKTKRRPRPNQPSATSLAALGQPRGKRTAAPPLQATRGLEHARREELIRLAQTHKLAKWYWSWYRTVICGNNPDSKLSDLSNSQLRRYIQAMNNLAQLRQHPQLGSAIEQVYGYQLDIGERNEFVWQLTDPEIAKLLVICREHNQDRAGALPA